MTISPIKNGILIETDNGDVLYDAADISKYKNCILAIDPKKIKIMKEYEGLVIQSAGEYEKGGVMITALNSSDKNKLDLVELSSELINFLILEPSTINLSKDYIEGLPQIHVMVIRVINDKKVIQNQIDIISEIEPNYLIIIDGDSTSEFEKTYGEKSEVVKKLKIKFSDFSDDEYITKLFTFS